MRAKSALHVFLLMLPLMLIATFSKAQENNIAGVMGNLSWFRIGTSLPIMLETNDQVSDGCWNSVTATQNAIKLEFQRSNLEISDNKETASTYLLLNAIGYKTNDYSCVAYVSLHVSSFAIETTLLGDMTLRSGDYPTFWQNGTLLSGSKSDMSNRIKNVAIELTQSLILRISEEKKKFRNNLNQNVNISDDQKSIWDTYIKVVLEQKPE
ncbi:hypothetical protein [Thalassospira xiamenensis]|uniref:hypothetical protein n=1 Tax=Thalassospira xiamenensis TaxID=220697 RepID=UPI003AA96C74